MRDEPDGLSNDSIAAAVRVHWGLELASVLYQQVGFGSYHWLGAEPTGAKWFITADVIAARDDEVADRGFSSFKELSAAYATAFALSQRGLGFVVAPVSDLAGQLVRRIDAGWAVALFHHIDGQPCGRGTWRDVDASSRAARIVGSLHCAEPPASTRRFEFTIRHRSSLFDGLAEPWDSGPYGERTRTMLCHQRKDVEALLSHYDELVQEVVAGDETWVLTHGEPHSANFIRDTSGDLHLIDWDTVRLAPAERDLAALPLEEPGVLAAYQVTAGHLMPRPAAMELFRAWWDVSEICGYVDRFRKSHQDSLDDQKCWSELEKYLDIGRRWPQLGGHRVT